MPANMKVMVTIHAAGSDRICQAFPSTTTLDELSDLVMVLALDNDCEVSDVEIRLHQS